MIKLLTSIYQDHPNNMYSSYSTLPLISPARQGLDMYANTAFAYDYEGKI